MTRSSILLVLSLAVAASAFDLEGFALHRRQAVPTSIPTQCQSQCSAFVADIQPCASGTSAQEFLPCLCGPTAQQDFISCATCDSQLLSAAGTTTPQQAAQDIQAFCASESGSAGSSGLGGGVPSETAGGLPSESGGGLGGPTGTSSGIGSTPSGSSSATCCAAWVSDIEPCQTSGNYVQCTCTPATEQDFLSCVSCNSAVLGAFNTTSPQQALSLLQEYCQSGGTGSGTTGSSGSSGGSPFAGLAGLGGSGSSGASPSSSSGNSGGGLPGLPGGKNAASSVGPVFKTLVTLVGVALAASLF